MMNTRFRLATLGLLATIGLAGGSQRAGADPASAPAAAPHDPELNYVYFHDDHTSMSGDSNDIERARRLRQGKEQLLWFRDGGQDYVVRDPAVLKQVEATWQPVAELGEAQGKVGSQLGELGSQQGQLGSQQGVLGARQGTLAVREAALDMRDNDSLTPGQRDEIARQRHELRNQQRALDKQIRALSKPMKELGEKMELLSRDMNALSRKMDVASHKAQAELRGLLRRVIATGAATPAR